MSRACSVALVLLALSEITWTQQPRTHDLTLTPEHVPWGYYDSRVAPVLPIRRITLNARRRGRPDLPAIAPNSMAP